MSKTPRDLDKSLTSEIFAKDINPMRSDIGPTTFGKLLEVNIVNRSDNNNAVSADELIATKTRDEIVDVYFLTISVGFSGSAGYEPSS